MNHLLPSTDRRQVTPVAAALREGTLLLVTVEEAAADALKVDQAGDLAQEATALIRAGDTMRAHELAKEAAQVCRQTYSGLLQAGASPFSGFGAPPEIPLHLLDTAEGRALIDALAAAVAAAEKVDAQRGNVLPEGFPLQPGETRGTGYAETLSNLLKRLEVEVYGPRGRE